MKKLLFSLVLLSLVSCEVVKLTDDDKFNNLKKPVVVAAKSNLETKVSDINFYSLRVSASITLKDADGKFITFDGEKGIGAALFCTYNVKDTIK